MCPREHREGVSSEVHTEKQESFLEKRQAEDFKVAELNWKVVGGAVGGGGGGGGAEGGRGWRLPEKPLKFVLKQCTPEDSTLAR